ncbi:hypothetical protein GOV14_06975 [Candidatus Pacearchaeota archaeon]|nr:hypothetical protein [Candidatus Pacearchaeota archaeon]
MLPKKHFIIGIILSVAIYTIFPFIGFFNTLIIFLSSVFIDFDHYLLYIFRKKNISPFRFWSWSIKTIKMLKKMPPAKRKKFKKPLFIFHVIEFWILLGVLSFFWNFFIFVLLGIAIHMIADWVDLCHRKDPLFYKFSLLYTIAFNRKGKNLISL